MQATYAYDFSTKVSTSCTEQSSEGGVGLWQYVVNKNDGSGRTHTTHLICRYGPGLYNSPPACPWTACQDK